MSRKNIIVNKEGRAKAGACRGAHTQIKFFGLYDQKSYNQKGFSLRFIRICQTFQVNLFIINSPLYAFIVSLIIF